MTTITAYEQLTPLDLRRDIIKPDGVKSLFKVLNPFVVKFKTAESGDSWIDFQVPPEFYTDLASIPKWVPKWVAAKVGPHIEAAVLHDYIYVVCAFPKEVADALFLFVMEHDGVGRFQSWYMHKAVRLGGRGAW